jgi:hypothetical protein
MEKIAKRFSNKWLDQNRAFQTPEELCRVPSEVFNSGANDNKKQNTWWAVPTLHLLLFLL